MLDLTTLTLIANITLPTGTTSISGLLSWANGAVNNTLGMGLLLAMLLIGTIGGALKGMDIEMTLTASGFVCTLIALLMLILNPPLVSSLVPAIFGGVTLIGAVLLLMRGGGTVF
jgi:hypothetical protein